MNKRRLGIIAKWLEAGAPHKNGVVGFNIGAVLNETECGAVCCIAGAAQQFFGTWSRDSDLREEADDLLGLTLDQGDELFCPPDFSTKKYTAAHAARTIRHFMATGEINWKACRKGMPS